MPWSKQFMKKSHVVVNFPHLPNHKQLKRKTQKNSSFAFVVPQPWAFTSHFAPLPSFKNL
jgi:hypothetical protein